MRRKNKVFCKYETKRTLTENKEEGTSLKTGEWLYIKHVSSANSSVVGHPGEKFYYIAGNLGRYWYSLYMLFLSFAVHASNSASHLVRFLFITPAICGCFDNSTALARKRPGVTNAVTIFLSIMDIFSAITIKKFFIFVKILDLFKCCSGRGANWLRHRWWFSTFEATCPCTTVSLRNNRICESRRQLFSSSVCVGWKRWLLKLFIVTSYYFLDNGINK